MDIQRKRLAATMALAVMLSGCVEGSDRETKAELMAGRNHYIQGDYAAAVATLDGFAGRHDSPEYAARALLIQGKAEIGRRNWSAARDAFQQLIDRYPKSLEAEKARYKLGEVAEFGGELAEAARRYRNLAEAPNPIAC